MASAGFHTVSIILMVVALVLSLLATISTPAVKSLTIASTSDHNYGIFGYCDSQDSNCNVGYPYSVSDVDKNGGWTLGNTTRDTLAKIFILCPIACGFSLITLVAIIISHFLASGALIFGIVINIISFILTTITAIIVVLVFYPHVTWGGWILIGAAAANLISLIFLFLALRFNNHDDYDDVEDRSLNDLEVFDDKFNNPTSTTNFMPPSTSGFKHNPRYDDNSSISKDYEFKPLNQPQVSNTMTNSSIYNSNPQLANDFTQHDKPSTHSFGSRTIDSNNERFEDAQPNFVNGPNTPISSKQQMAPVFIPNVATPTTNDVPRSEVPSVPYPTNGPLNRPPYSGADMSVFEHHPEVEGHRPFTELPDDELVGGQGQNHRGSQGSDMLGSDASSNFTSVSQRAVNPKYNPQFQQPPPSQGNHNGQYYQVQDSYFPPQSSQSQPPFSQPQPSQYDNNYPQQQQFQPQYHQGPPPQQQPQQFYQPNFNKPMGMPVSQPMPTQNRFARPTASDNALANNPDFALGGPAGRKKAPFGARNMNANKFQGGARRDGPFGM